MAASVPDSPAAPASTHPHGVHLLVVHGVGRHDHLSNLLRTYQSFRANVTSVEAPITFEDQIPGWRLTQFDEASSPPRVRLEPRDRGGSVAAVSLYEVNYAGFAGVLRRNHPIDLMNLFLGAPSSPPSLASSRTSRRSSSTRTASS